MSWTQADLDAVTRKRLHASTRAKYRNVKKTLDGVTFDSTKEALRYTELRLLEHAGQIAALELQPTYALVVNQMLICEYRGDFRYIERREVIVEDCKGMKTPAYRLKCKLMRALHGITIRET